MEISIAGTIGYFIRPAVHRTVAQNFLVFSLENVYIQYIYE